MAVVMDLHIPRQNEPVVQNDKEKRNFVFIENLSIRACFDIVHSGEKEN